MAKGCLLVAIVGVVMVVLAGVMAMGMYNGVVAKDEECNKAWANVEAVLQRRFDLIPNLVQTVKGYAGPEGGVGAAVGGLRRLGGAGGRLAAGAGVASRREGALGRLMVVVESYPDLKANANFIALQDELAGTENRIGVERQRYNASVQVYNTAIRQMPAALVARLAGFVARKPFEAAPAAAQAPSVSF